VGVDVGVGVGGCEVAGGGKYAVLASLAAAAAWLGVVGVRIPA